jgi:hypothetical protein
MNGGKLTLVGRTVTANCAEQHSSLNGSGSAEGIYNAPTGILTLVNSTVSDNIAYSDPTALPSPQYHAGGIFNYSGSVSLTNSIVADQRDGADCEVVGGTIASNGYSLDSEGTCGLTGSTDQSSVDPLLGSLGNNGGPTWTHALLSGSPAIDAVPTGTNGCGTDINADQRGVSRPQGSACDI